MTLSEVEVLPSSGAIVVDACRSLVRTDGAAVSLATRPVLFALARTLGEAYPAEASRSVLLARAFGARFADESHRARLRVEIGRLRAVLRPVLDVQATRNGFALAPRGRAGIVVLAPLVDDDHAPVLALLADGEAWSSSSLALALSVSPRTVLRSLARLAEGGRVHPVGRGRARRWTMPPSPGFPTSLLLPGPPPGS